MRIASFLLPVLCLVQIAQGATLPVFALDETQVAPNVYVFAENDRHGIVSGTVTVVIGADSVLVFDTTHRVSSAKQIIAAIKKKTNKPVRFIVNSHWHEDHWTGNGTFAAAFPAATFYAHPFTADMIAKRQTTFRGQHCKEELAAEYPALRKQLASGKRDDGTVLSEAGIAFRKQLIGELDAQTSECDAMVYRGSDVTFAQQIAFDLGGRSAQVMYLGRANTAGDVIAYLPDDKILLTGDLVVAPFPFATQSYIREWAAVLDQLMTIDATTIVPGHGPIMHDKQYIADLATLLHSVSAQVHAIYKPGMTTEDVRGYIDIKSIRAKFVGDDPFIAGNFDYMVLQLAVERAVQEEQGALKPEG